ncbi:gap junction beta-1 protein-like [Gastrophryne carolinensis]
MALSAEAYEQFETVTCLLSGATSLTSRIGRVVLSLFFSARFGILAFGARSAWLNEAKDFQCNSTQTLCHPSCFDEFSPISSYNFFALQMVVLFSHALCVAGYNHLSHQQSTGWLQTQLRKKNVQMKLHIIGLTSRMLIEVLFILMFYKETKGFVHRRTTWCQTPLCEPFVFCTDTSSTLKYFFSLALCAASVVSAMTCFWELVLCLPSVQHSPLVNQTNRKKQNY